MARKSFTTVVKEWIADGEKEIYVNLINLGSSGKKITTLLEQAGYTSDNAGPQRYYTKGDN